MNQVKMSLSEDLIIDLGGYECLLELSLDELIDLYNECRNPYSSGE